MSLDHTTDTKTMLRVTLNRDSLGASGFLASHL